MAWIAKRGKVYEARWVVNGKQHRKSTGIKIAGEPGCPASKAKRLAQQAADSMEQLAAGKTPLIPLIDEAPALQGAGAL